MESLNYLENLEKSPGIVELPNVKYVGFWVRFVAQLIDTIVCLVIFAIPYTVMMVFELIFYWSSDDPSEIFMIASTVVAVLVFWLYESIFISSKYMATPGKMLLKIKVADEEGNRVSFKSATIRNIIKVEIGIILGGYFMAVLILICFLSPLVIPFTSKKQAIHDFIANTVVVYA